MGPLRLRRMLSPIPRERLRTLRRAGLVRAAPVLASTVPMKPRLPLLAVGAAVVVSFGAAPSDPSHLKAPREFAHIKDTRARSAALFGEASRVLFHPRCANCHPSDDHPRQGDRQVVHDPPVFRGPASDGVPGLRCGSCHQDRNLAHARVPGAPSWHLAPLEMAWLGRSPAAVCAQIKDKARNGGKTLDEVWHHTAHDALVAWGWQPGHDRTPAPGSQKEFAALVRAWIDTGAECPQEAASR